MEEAAAPLLNHSSSDDICLIGEDGDYFEAKGLRAWWRIFCIETIKLWRIGGPIAVQILCQFGTNTVATIFVGHLGDVELSAFTIAVSVIGTFSFGFMLGMGSALETLCGQAFGAGQVHMLGVYMQRSMIIIFVACVLMLPVYIFATPLLKLLGQHDDIANLAGFYTILTIPQLFSLSVTFPTQKFLQAQSKVSVLAWIGVIAIMAQTVFCWLFINVFGWGSVGAALAFDLTSIITSASQFIYVVVWCTDGWKGLSRDAFKDIWAFVRLSLSSAVMLCLELWYMMSITVLTGDLDDAVTAVGSLSICTNIDGFETMLFVGVNAAIAVRVSNELGLGHPRAAKYSVYVTVFQSFIIGLLCMSLILVTRNHFAIIFTNSEPMQKAVAHLASLLGVTMLLNSVQPVISGVAIGAGWQTIVAYINLACYYILGLPLGYMLGYWAHLGVKGIWGGMIVGVILQTILLFLILYKTNWDDEANKTKARMQKWGGQEVVIEKSSSEDYPIINGSVNGSV